MKIVVTRVDKASVEIDGQCFSQINEGLLCLVGIGLQDNEAVVEKMAKKVVHLRIFEDENQKMNKSLLDLNASLLSVSQFTLYGDTSSGNRPSFKEAASIEKAKQLYDYFNVCLKSYGIHIQTGVFQADMKVMSLNNGPVTILMDSGKW